MTARQDTARRAAFWKTVAFGALLLPVAGMGTYFVGWAITRITADWLALTAAGQLTIYALWVQPIRLFRERIDSKSQAAAQTAADESADPR
ncbi:MAG: hypothetical protein LLG14_24840 [Nocardiaceae bacterium]|nr:hypothetical protein [Nocardiaceae bacterium]